MSSEDIRITPTGAKIHCSEKVSTGDYESATVSQTVEFDIETDAEDGFQEDLRERLMLIQKHLQRDVEKAAENRVKVRDHEDWGTYER